MTDELTAHQTEIRSMLPPRVFVQVAAFCEAVLQEQTGVRSLIRVYDQLTVRVHDEAIMSAPGVVQQLLLVLSLKSRKEDTVHTIGLQFTTPDGREYTEEPQTYDFSEDSTDENSPSIFVQVNIPVLFRQSGHYRCNVFANNEIIASIPLHITLLGPTGEPASFKDPDNE